MTAPTKPLFRLSFFKVLLYSLLVLPAIWPLLQKGYFYTHDDIQVLRLQQMSLCFKYLQLPCRWVPDMGAGFGHPLFNYHPVFPYYLGQLIHSLGISFVDTSKALFASSFYFSGLFFLLFASLFFSFPVALAGAVLFVYAPYHSLDIYVRGALTEAWGLTFFPLILYSLLRYLKNPSKGLFILSILSLSGLFLSHPILTLLFTPLAFIWGLAHILASKSKQFLSLSLIFVLAICLSAFFLIPAFFERSYVSIDFLTSNYYNYVDHFVSIRQLFLNRLWGWGPSRLGPDDEISFQMGWPHWWLGALALLTPLLYLIKHKRPPQLITFAFFALLFLGSIYLTHARSVWFWQLFPLLAFVQFPWRFLTLVIFANSLLALFFINASPQKLKVIISTLVIGITLALNLNYFVTKDQNKDVTDATMLSGKSLTAQSRATLMDYVPIATTLLPQEVASSSLFLSNKNATVSSLTKQSNRFSFTVSNPTSDDLTLSLPIFNFPTWNLTTSTGRPLTYTVSTPSGTLKLTLPPGKYAVDGILTDTPLRHYSNLLSLFTALLLLIYAAAPKPKKHA